MFPFANYDQGASEVKRLTSLIVVRYLHNAKAFNSRRITKKGALLKQHTKERLYYIDTLKFVKHINHTKFYIIYIVKRERERKARQGATKKRTIYPPKEKIRNHKAP